MAVPVVSVPTMTANSEKPSPSSGQDAGDGKEREEKDRLEDKLDEALNETFPASDPFEIGK